LAAARRRDEANPNPSEGNPNFFGRKSKSGAGRPAARKLGVFIRRFWGVYVRRSQPERVLAYLARYTHRAAIANSRLVGVHNDEVAFSYKDYRRGGRPRVMRLAPHEFIRRFLLHVLPDRFSQKRRRRLSRRGQELRIGYRRGLMVLKTQT
jgi:hypothetical protein